ncbi:MarR family winged helix-turn-helix transcriptional regulator [Deinococcus sp. MIMF12]|uniref:MarR family winged helix-turn-helix transcriptional regulator n=1 Tax=Deinococcus rhizophilus TaxID=3049544 RepID=A0ABT7JDE0_9DEIO|nr:MarR family winged helix-turn-helix transcriptional regulator [Deinococcus rhizophilus]MDL2343057.1 MarR family winged helix-turn-helix transcriptional regulator [Deinococcus rhizophilus]
MRDPDPLHTPELAFLTALWDVWQALTQRGEAELRGRHGLDLRSFVALAYVQGGTAQPAALARELGVPRYEVSRVLAALEGQGAVTRGHHDPDARRVTVAVTPAGRALWEEALETVREVTGPALAALPPGARSALPPSLAAVAQAARFPLPSTPQEMTP